MRLMIVAVAAVVVMGCGTPGAGDSCAPEGGIACEDASNGLSCESGILRAVACKGSGGCVSGDGRASCDTTRNIAGDGCFPSQEGGAQCSVANVRELLICTDGTFTVSQTCPTRCVVSGSSVSCE